MKEGYSIKKYLRTTITTLIFLSFALIADAQIQRSFFGLDLGRTTKSQATKTLQAKGYKIKDLGDKIMIVDVEFGGRAWSGVGLSFYKGKLSEVKFIKLPKITNLQYYHEILLDNLKKKYARYYVPGLSTKNDVLFTDKNTAVALVYSKTPEESVTLLYQDNQEVKDWVEQDSDEL